MRASLLLKLSCLCRNKKTSRQTGFFSGTSGRTRTVTPFTAPDFESGVSTNSTTLASESG